MATKTTKTTKTARPVKPAKAATPPAAVKPAEPAETPAPRLKKAPATTAPATPHVTFRLSRPGASSVALAGTFNNWSASAAPLRLSTNGVWSVELPLPPGTYEYRFVVDDHWIHDPAAVESAPNPFGGVNSVVRVTG